MLQDLPDDAQGLLPTAVEDATDEFPAAVAPPARSASKASSKPSGRSRQEPPPPGAELEKAHIIVEFGASRWLTVAFGLLQIGIGTNDAVHRVNYGPFTV